MIERRTFLHIIRSRRECHVLVKCCSLLQLAGHRKFPEALNHRLMAADRENRAPWKGDNLDIAEAFRSEATKPFIDSGRFQAIAPTRRPLVKDAAPGYFDSATSAVVIGPSVEAA